jgi:hypothetical protein
MECAFFGFPRDLHPQGQLAILTILVLSNKISLNIYCNELQTFKGNYKRKVVLGLRNTFKYITSTKDHQIQKKQSWLKLLTYHNIK